MTALALNPGTDRAAWLEARRACLCATDVAAILGLNPYKSPLSVWLEKTGQAEVEEVTAAMKRGTRMERYVAEQYVEETGYGVTPSQLYRHPRFEQFGATPDYEVEDAPDMRLLECKTAKWMAARDFGPAGTDEVPLHYTVQCQWQMYVTGAEHVDLAVLVGDFDDFRLYPVPRHEGVIRQLETRALDWWERYIEAECPPPLSGAECDAEWLKARFPQDTGATIMATPEVDDLCRRYADARRAFVDAQTEKERLENEIKAAMEEASVLETSIGAFTWKRARPTVREKFDAAALKADDPETYARYAVADVTPGSRRFLCPMKDK